MKRSIVLAALVATSCGGSAAPGGAPARAPDFEATRLDGTPVSGRSLWQSKPVLLVFMTAW